jgi:hypothetical protein
MPEPVSPELTAHIQSLNSPSSPSLYAIEGNVITGRWNFENPDLAQALVDGGASSNFRYIVTLNSQKHTYKSVEQDVGYNNGRFRAYRGYSRGMSVNPFTVIVWLIQRGGRKRRTGTAKPAHKYSYEELKQPLRNVLESGGWKRKGLIR